MSYRSKTSTIQHDSKTSVKKGYINYVLNNKLLYIMLLPGILHFLIFKYTPMVYLSIAFQNYSPYKGLAESNWVGFAHFQRFFTSDIFPQLLRNTSIIAVVNLLIFFPVPIIVSILLNELHLKKFKRFIQTSIYIPHFISWPVVASLTLVLFTTQGGIVNEIISNMGFDKIPFLMSSKHFHGVYLGQMLWKETGYSTIIYLAAIAGINLSLYESAVIDGAGRFKQIWYITLPSIRSTITILYILRLGRFLEVGFEQIFLLRNSLNRVYSEVFDTYVYQYGVQQGQYSFTTAIGLMTSVIGLVMVLLADYIVKKWGEEGIL